MAKSATTSPILGPDGLPYVAKAIPIDGSTSISDQSVSSIVSGQSGTRVAELEVYWMLATKHPGVSACISLTSDAVASEGYDVAPVQSEDARPLSAADDERVQAIHEFFTIASPWETDRARRYAIAYDILAFGFATLRKWRVNSAVVALERIDPRSIQARLTPKGDDVAEYVVRARNVVSSTSSNQAERVKPADVIFFARSGGGPLSLFSSPLEALDLTLSTDFAQRRYREAFGRLGGKVGLILASENATDEQFKATKAIMNSAHTGAENAYRTLYLPGDWKLLNKAQSGQDDADFVQATGLNREDIAGVYHVPTSLITFSANALGSAGKGDDREFFESFAVLPLEEIIYERLTLSLLRDEFEIDDLALVPKRRNKIRLDRFDAAVKAVKFGMTGNEARRIVNAPPIEDPEFEMDAPLFLGTTNPNGPVGDEPIAAEQSADSSSGTNTGEAQQATDGADSNRDSKQPTPRKPKNGVRQAKAKATFRKQRRLLDATHQRAVDTHQVALAAKLVVARESFEADFWKRAKTVKADLRPRYLQKTALAITAAQVAALARAIMDAEGESYADAIYDAQSLLVEVGWTQGKALLDLTTGFGVVPTATLSRLLDDANAYESKLKIAEQDALRGVLTQAFNDGLSVAQTRDALKQTFAEGFHAVDEDGNVTRTMPTDKWATMTARTELSAAANLGMMDLYDAAGVKRIQWVAANSPTTCDYCGDADGEIVDLGDNFPDVDVDQPPAHPNCCPAGTMILTDRGPKPIESIEIGDRVLTHRARFRRVLRRTSNVVAEDIVEIAVGPRVLRVTGNHPVYTGNGWTPAAALKPRDNVAGMHAEPMLCSAGEAHDVPAELAQRALLGGVLGQLSAGSMPTAAIDFNRQHTVGQRDVDIELVDGVIGNRLEAGFHERADDNHLVPGFDAPGLARSARPDSLDGLLDSADGIVRRGGNALAVLGRRVGVKDAVCGADVSPFQAEATEAGVNSSSSEAVSLRQVENRFATDVQSVNLARDFIGYPACWHTVIVPLEHVHRIPFAGTVYNFAVEEDESYVADGIVVHNCVCTTSPADDELGDFRGSQEQQDRAARGGYSAGEYADKFGFEHPLDAKRAGGAPTGDEDY